MRRKYTDPELNKEMGEPRYICPACGQRGLLFDASDRSQDAFQTMCRVCGFHYFPVLPSRPFPVPDAEKKWGEAWKECGAEVLFEKDPEERSDYFTRIQYAFLCQTYYIPTDEEVVNRFFDVERLFSQHGLLHKRDSSRKITVRCEDGKTWEFPYETNTLLYLDDPEKYFTVAEEGEKEGSYLSGRIYLAVGEYLSKKSSGERQYRGFEMGIFPEAYGGVYSLDKECVLVGLDNRKYYFDIGGRALNYKNAEISDAELLVEIYNSAFYDDFIRYGHCPAYGRSKENMEQSIQDYPKIIAYDQDKPVGVISFKEEEPGKYYIGCLAVVKEEQGRGIGTLLMKHFLREHPDWKELTLVTPKDSERNIKFYTERFGFEIVGEEDDGSVTVLWFKRSR